MHAILRVSWLAFVALLTSTVARAEPYTILPNGDLVFNVIATATGSFQCASVVPCTGSGSSITLHSGGGTATFSFTGLNASFAAGNTTIPVTLGTFEDSTTDGFSLPGTLNPMATLFFFNFAISHSSPAPGSDSVFWGFNSSFMRFGEGGRTYLQLPIGSQPPQYHYTGIIYTMQVFPLTLPLNGTKDLVGDVGVVPEPASIALVGTGLIAACRRRRRKRT